MTHRILLVEDSATQLLAIKKALESEGYSVITAQSGAEGLVHAYNELPDLIISDVVMAGMNGYQLCRLVKNDPDLSLTPVILLTKLDGSIDRFWGLKSGADRYIPKEAGFTSLINATKEIFIDSVSRPRLNVFTGVVPNPTPEDINNKLNQLLERLLFEATLVDEVRQIGEDILDLEVIAEKLFALLSSVLEYRACALVVAQRHFSVLHCDVAQEKEEPVIRAFVHKTALNIGLPPFRDDIADAGQKFEHTEYAEHASIQPIETAGQRVGLLVVVPIADRFYQPGDQKVIRLICEELSTVLRLYLSHTQRTVERIPGRS